MQTYQRQNAEAKAAEACSGCGDQGGLQILLRSVREIRVHICQRAVRHRFV